MCFVNYCILDTCSFTTSSLLPDIITDVVPHQGLCQPWHLLDFSRAGASVVVLATSSHPFPVAGQATLHGYFELRNMILELDMSIGSLDSLALIVYYNHLLFIILIICLIFLFFLLPRCILPHDKDHRCLLFIIGFN